jgi:long-chain acyl-CoA synthetase
MRPIRQPVSIAEIPALRRKDIPLVEISGAEISAGMSLWQVLRANAIEASSSTAYRAKLRGLWKSWTWVEVEREVVSIHGMLAEAGIRPGTTVAIAGETNPRLYWYVLAIQRAGALPILVNSRIGSSEFASVYEEAKFAFFVAGSEAQVDVAVDARSLCPELRRVIALDRGLEVDDHGGLVVTERDLQGPDRADSRADPCIALQTDPAVAISTYDEAGEHILVVCSHVSIAKAARDFASLAGMNANNELISFLPISWFGDFLQFSAALYERALLSSVENSATAVQDMQLLAPDVILAPVSFYRKMLARIEVNIHHSSRIFVWIYKWSNSLAARAWAHKAKFGRAGFVDVIAARLLDVVFRAPLRDVIGFSKIRSAFCAEGALPPDIAARFESLGIDIRPIDLDPRYGGVLGSVASPAPESDPVDIAIQGVELTRDAAGRALCRSQFAAIGILQSGGIIAPLKTDADGWGRACIFGKIDQAGTVTSLEDIDLDDLDDQVALSLRAHITRLNSELLIRNSILRPDGGGGWVAVINPDLEFLRAISPDAGSRYHELIEQEEVISALADIIRKSNLASQKDAAAIVSQISSFAWLVRPLSASEGTLTRNGGLQHRQVQSLVPTSALKTDLVNVKIAQLSKLGVA